MFPRAAMVRCATLIVKVLGMYWRKTGTSHYHEQQELQGKGVAIKELDVCWLILNLKIRMFGHKRSYRLPLVILGCWT